MIETITALHRPRCRVRLAEPDHSQFDWQSIEPLPDLAVTSVDEPVPQTHIRVVAAAKALHVRFDCHASDPSRLKTPSLGAPLAQCDHARVEIMPDNDPTRRYSFAGDYRGLREATFTRMMPAEAHLDANRTVWQTSSPITDQWHRYHGIRGSHWYIEFIIPWRAIGLRRPPCTVGLRCARTARNPDNAAAVGTIAWPRMNATSTCPAMLEHGEAIIGDDAGAPASLELDRPTFGDNTARLILGDQWPKRPNTIRIATRDADGTDHAVNQYVVEPGQDVVTFEYQMRRDLSSYVDVYNTQRLALEAYDADNETVLYRASLPMDRHLGVCVIEPYGDGAVGSDEEDLGHRERWFRRVVGAVPSVHRRNTTQGAPSDFCIYHDSGKLLVNLMADDAWQQMVKLIEQKFKTTEDRLVAAMAFIGQKTVTNLVMSHLYHDDQGRQTYHSALHEWIGPLSIIRYGGGPAVSRAAALAGLLSHLRDPATGKPFNARVVSLRQSGGPTQVTRKFEKASAIAPFIQHPGPVGAVAVDYQNSQTLLDPNGMAFFPVSGSKLATVEQIVADETIRLAGAGRLAGIYAQLDIDEMRRHPTNRLLSKGVFPELCPNEVGEDKPFDQGVCQNIRPIIAARGVNSAPARSFAAMLGVRAKRSAAAVVSWNDQELTVRVTVKGSDTKAFDDRDRQLERVNICVDPRHDHETFLHAQLTLAGGRNLWREFAAGIQTLFKNLSTESHIEQADLTASNWSGDIRSDGDGYEAIVRLPWDVLGVDGPHEIPPTIGLNVWIDGRNPQYEQIFLAVPRWHLPADPFSFADVYLTGAQVVVEKIDFGVSCWGDNVAKATLRNNGDKPAAVTLKSRTHLGMERRVTRAAGVSVTVPAGQTAEVDLPYRIAPEEKMTSGSPQRIVVVGEAGGKVFFESSYPHTYCGVLASFHRYGKALGKCSNPKPGEKNFLEKKINYICSRLPELERVTTRNGAASDFVIRAKDGSVEFNLMKAGVMAEMGDYITKRFDNDLDRVLGMFYFNYAPDVARHMSGGHRIVDGVGALSILRGNFAGAGGNCGPHSRAFAGLLGHLKLNGKPIIATTVGIWGHVISSVEWNGSRALLDGDVGHIFLTPDGTSLPTIEELDRTADVLTTAGDGEFGRYFSFHKEHVVSRAPVCDNSFAAVFPPGAPKG